jgi:Lipid A 3-O-deacylase (PagL)
LAVWVRTVPVIMLISFCALAAAQTLAPEHVAIREGAAPSVTGALNEFGVWMGYSPHSFVLQGTSLHRQLFLLNLEYARRVLVHGPLTLKYTADVVPVALEMQPTSFYIVHEHVLRNRAGTIFGAGANPFGLQLNFGHRKLQPFVNSSGGFLYFTRQVPAPASSQFNFTFNFGGGMQLFTRSRRSFTVGYKYHHLSNADTGTINPGIDSNVIYLGFSIPGWGKAR